MPEKWIPFQDNIVYFGKRMKNMVWDNYHREERGEDYITWNELNSPLADLQARNDYLRNPEKYQKKETTEVENGLNQALESTEVLDTSLLFYGVIILVVLAIFK